jgi:hypothetical protein
MVDDLDKVETVHTEDKERLMAIKRGIQEALKPVDETIEKIHSIRDEINNFLGKIALASGN